jgi:hypothetical protein
MSTVTDPLAECDEHGGLLSACPVCQRSARPQSRPDPWSRAFGASYDTDRCDGCPEMIRAGELIRVRQHPTQDRLERRHVQCC